MAIPTADELEVKREELIARFEEYCTQVADGFESVVCALRDQRYAEACSIMSTISAHQGQASVKMRAVLVKGGFIVRERNDD